MRLILVTTNGSHIGRLQHFEESDRYLVGRSSRAHFHPAPTDKFLSRVHFLLKVLPEGCQLMDMGSRNGTYVNGKRVDRANLADGDRIEAGRTTFRVLPEPQPQPGAPTEQPNHPEHGPILRCPFCHYENEECGLFCEQCKSDLSGVVPSPSSPALSAGSLSHVPESTSLGLPFPDESGESGAASSCRVCGNGVGDTVMVSSPALCGVCQDCVDGIDQQEQLIPGYYCVRELGQGSMGVVQLAIRQQDGTLVAIKTIVPAVACSPTQTKRFWREAEILKQLEHPHIVAFRDMGEANGILYFAMEYVRGLNAGRLMRKGGVPLAIPRAVHLVCQVLDALHYAHNRVFVHRDIKPSDMLVSTEDGREIVKIADFGLARVYQSSHLSGLTMTGDIGGTVAFIPPEQITEYRKAQPAADQYAAAATLYNLLTAWYVYNLPNEFQKQLKMILEEDLVPIRSRRSEIPEGLEKVIHRALARQPSERWPDVSYFRQALLSYCS